jgi:IS30 family transposase
MISKRPEEANQRKVPGHWEVDTVLPSKDGKASLVVVVDRHSRLTRIKKIKSKCSQEVEDKLITMLSRYPKRIRKTLTYDNGAENSRHLLVNAALGTTSYFCNSYCSWEKGTVENTISLIRRFIPRNTSLNHVTPEFIAKIERWINHRPKKILNFRSPYEIFSAVALSP